MTRKQLWALLSCCIAVAMVAWMVSSLAFPKEESPFDVRNHDVVVVTSSPGGDIFTFMAQYNTVQVKHQYMRIEGVCVSACTYFEGLVDRDHVCAGPHALFGFHGIYSGVTGEPNFPLMALIMPLVYTQHLRDVLKAHGFDGTTDIDKDKNPTGLIWLTADDIGIQRCPT